MPIDLKKLTPDGLKNLLENSRRLSNADMELAVIQEMHERSMATSREYATLSWNQRGVDEALTPFALVAAQVPRNERKATSPRAAAR